VETAVCTVEYAAMILVDKKVVLRDAGQFLTVEGQAVTVYTSVMYLVKVTGASKEGLEVVARGSCVLEEVDKVGMAITTGALLVPEIR
jgi:hypothetical protein